jgi:lipid-A-disaccharide synthase-like uncharacterized protein
MQENNIWFFAIGFLAQLFFSARILYQWIVSEKAGKVLSPAAFWVLSISGSYLLFIYGVLRNDFAIILGQFISYYIYLWNLNMHGKWGKIAGIIKAILLMTPLVATGLMLRDLSGFTDAFLHNKAVPMRLLIFGSAGQVIFSLRFIYQFIYSSAHHQSALLVGFWAISLLGSSIIIAYALFRIDPVLILGQSFGFVAYTRNIMIGHKNKEIRLYA